MVFIHRWMAGTQFEAARARKAFPCFDEPAMKAQFLISLGRKESWTALTSTPKFQTAPKSVARYGLLILDEYFV